MNHLPAKDTNLGRVLRTMEGTGWLTSGEVRKNAGLHPDTAVTARIRDLRKMGCVVPSASLPHPTKKYKRVWLYRLHWAPRWVRDGLRAEREKMASMERAA